MATTNDRFSIRDYAAKMRIADLANSWPFVGGKDEKPPLPPISICRFRWWTDELSTARSAAEAAETKAAETQKDELAEETNDIIEYQSPKSPTTKKTTEDEELRMPKPKMRMPKKRSIAELFASAPQIEPAAADQSNGQEGDGEGKEEEEEKVMMRKRKGKRLKGPIKMEIRALKKEKICKPKMTSSGRSHLPQDPINAKALRKSAEGVVESKKKFLRLTMQNKHCLLQTPNLISRNQKVVVKKLPVRGILKSKNRVASARKTRKMNNAKTVKFIKRCCKTTRHVTFSEKDDMLGHGKKKCSSIDLPQFKSLCKIFSDVLTKSSVMNNSSKFHELPAASAGPQVANAGVEEDTNAGVVDRADESSSHKNRSSDSLGNVDHRKLVDSINRSCSSTEKASMSAMIDLNLAIEGCNDLDCFNPSTENFAPNCTNSVDPDFKGTSQRKGSSTSTEFNLQRVLPSITPTERNFVSTSNATELLTATKNPSSHSSTRLIARNEENEKLCRHYFHVDMNCYHHIPENQLEQHCSPKDLLSNMDLAYSHGFYADKRIHGFYADKQVDDINANHFEIMKGKALDAASYQNDRLDWCQNQYHPRERRLAEFIGPERLDIQNNEPVKEKYEFLHRHANKTNFSSHDGGTEDSTVDFFKRVDLQRQCNLDCELEPAVQPRIRLMGQNVIVGGSNRDCRSSIMPEKFLSKQRTYGSSTDRLHKLSDSPSIFHHTTRYVEPQFDSHIEDHGSESLPRTTGNNIFKVDVDGHAVLNKAFIGNSISGEESMMHQYYPTIASYQQNIQQNMLLSSTHWNHGQGVSCGTFLTPQSLARYNVPENSFQTVQLQPSEKLPRRLQRERNQLPTSLYSCQSDLSQPCRFFGSNLIPRQSPYNMPNSSQSSTFAPNSSQSSFISAVTATNSTSEVTKNNAMENKERGPHSSFTGFNSPVDALKFLKRPAGRYDALKNSAKRPHFEKQAKWSIPLEPQETDQMRDQKQRAPVFRDQMRNQQEQGMY